MDAERSLSLPIVRCVSTVPEKRAHRIAHSRDGGKLAQYRAGGGEESNRGGRGGTRRNAQESNRGGRGGTQRHE